MPQTEKREISIEGVIPILQTPFLEDGELDL